MASRAGCNVHLVAQTGKHPGLKGYLLVSMTDTGILSDAAGMLQCYKRIQQLYGATFPTLP